MKPFDSEGYVASPQRQADSRGTHLQQLQPALTPPQLAAFWRVSRDKVLTLIKRGELPAFNIALNPSGRPRFRIHVKDVLAFEQRRGMAKATRPARHRKNSSGGVIHFF
jgi:hypothetical protein